MLDPREKPEYFSPLSASGCSGCELFQPWSHSSSGGYGYFGRGNGCDASFPGVTLIPRLAPSSSRGGFPPLTIAGAWGAVQLPLVGLPTLPSPISPGFYV